MDTKSDELLLQVNLPLSRGLAPVPVLVHQVDRQKATARLILSDEGGLPVAELHLVGGQLMPEFDAIPMGTIDSFLAERPQQTQAVILAGGSEHGNLTLARAVHFMTGGPNIQDAEKALACALSTSRLCATWRKRIEEQARAIAAG